MIQNLWRQNSNCESNWLVQNTKNCFCSPLFLVRSSNTFSAPTTLFFHRKNVFYACVRAHYCLRETATPHVRREDIGWNGERKQVMIIIRSQLFPEHRKWGVPRQLSYTSEFIFPHIISIFMNFLQRKLSWDQPWYINGNINNSKYNNCYEFDGKVVLLREAYINFMEISNDDL